MAASILFCDERERSERCHKRAPWWRNRLRTTLYFDANIEAQTKVTSELVVRRYVLED